MEAHKLNDYENYIRPSVRTKRRLRFSWKPGTLVLVAVLAYAVFAFGQVYYQIHSLNKTKASLEAQLSQLQSENKALHDKAQMVNSDAYIEKLAREELGLVKPGETVMMPAYPGDVKPLIITDKNRVIGD